MILECTKCADKRCAGAAFQDAAYGPGQRVHNETDKSNPRVYRCTICESERGAGRSF
jgi:hypothetical protein